LVEEYRSSSVLQKYTPAYVITIELLQSILVDEEKHLDWLEKQISLIGQPGDKNYLVEQV